MPIFKPFMDTAMMRKPGNMGIISRSVCVTSSGALRSGVHGNGHAPFWSSGRWSDPPLDCNTRMYEPITSWKRVGLYDDGWSHLSDAGMMGHSAVA